MNRDPRLAAVLNETWPVLLDFDGPVTHLYIDGRNRLVSDRMRAVLPADLQPPHGIGETYDPLIVLRWAASHTPPEIAAAVEDASIAGEVDAATVTAPTEGSAEFITACADVGRPLVIVSNNAEQAIRTYLAREKLDQLVFAIIARTPRHPELMKPHPSAIDQALATLKHPANQVCMVGDSVTDIEVCHATGVQSIGFAKNPQRGRELHEAGADAVTVTMAELAHAIRISDGLPGPHRSAALGSAESASF